MSHDFSKEFFAEYHAAICPVSHLVKSAMGRSLKKKVELLGSEKLRPISECYLKYKL
ncbi:MAG: hypothetical protein AABY54_05670 [Deltaproteobacteria bacterium]